MDKDLTITRVEAIPVTVAGAQDFRISEGRTRVHNSVILRLHTNHEDLTGQAEIVCAPPGKPEEFSEEIVAAIKRFIAPVLIGTRVADRLSACRRVDQVLKGRAWTKAGVNVALYDLHARCLGIAVVDLLGGRLHQRIPVIGTVIGIGEPEVMAEQAQMQAQAGFAAVKIKLGETVRRDVARVAAVRAAIGDDIQLRVDANDHYQPASAIALARAIERYAPEHLEQPVARRDLLGLAEVRRNSGVPIMTDDTVASPEEAMTVIRLGCADRVKVKVTKHGLDGARLIIGMLEAAGITAVLGHVFEMGLAAVAEAHLALAAPNLAAPHEIGSMQPMGTDADIIVQKLHRHGGFLEVPFGPGLGVGLDWDRIESMRTDGPI
jgi:muconate cycloisomerase